MVIWIIGLSASGKTTLGSYIYNKLKPRYKNLVFIDGDIIREIMGNDLGHTIEDRHKNAYRITRLCQQLDKQGINVICSVLSIFRESQDWNKQNMKKYFEIYIKCDFDILTKDRDYKGLYQGALKGEIKNVVGVDIDFLPPKNPDITIINNESIDKLYEQGDQLVDKIANELE